jgi:hypothetical protein
VDAHPRAAQLAAHIISSLERRRHTPAVKSPATAAPCSASRPSYPAPPRPAPTNGRPPAAGPSHDAAGNLSRHSCCIRVRLRPSSFSRTDPSGPPQQIPMSVTLCPSLPVFVRVEQAAARGRPFTAGSLPSRAYATNARGTQVEKDERPESKLPPRSTEEPSSSWFEMRSGRR